MNGDGCSFHPSTYPFKNSVAVTFQFVLARYTSPRAGKLIEQGNSVRQLCDICFTVYVATFGTIFGETYSRKEQLWALEFGMLDAEKDEAKRPQFRGIPSYSKITFERELTYPEHHRSLKKMLGFCVLLLFLFVEVVINMTICRIRMK